MNNLKFDIFDGKWLPLKAHPSGEKKVSIFRFERIWCENIRIKLSDFKEAPAIAEFGVYNERN